jgi:hypothetical protein
MLPSTLCVVPRPLRTPARIDRRRRHRQLPRPAATRYELTPPTARPSCAMPLVGRLIQPWPIGCVLIRLCAR